MFVTTQTGLYLQKDDKTIAVANFYPELLDYAQLTGTAGTDEFRFRIQWIGVSGISVTGWYTMADLEKLNFPSLHPLFAVEPRRRRAMPDYIRGQLSQQTPRTVHRVSSQDGTAWETRFSMRLVANWCLPRGRGSGVTRLAQFRCQKAVCASACLPRRKRCCTPLPHALAEYSGYLGSPLPVHDSWFLATAF